MLNIYGHFMSMPSNKVRLCASFLELPHEYHHVDLQSGEQMSPRYLDINPFGRVPAIEDGGFKLSQSDAINRYLCLLAGPSAFYPDDVQDQAIVNQWNDYASQHIQNYMGRVFHNKIIAPLIEQEPDEKSMAFGERMLARDLPHFDTQLKDNQYLCGDNISLADLALIAALEPSEMVELDLLGYPNIVKWRSGIMERGFYRRVHARFGAEMNDAKS